MARAANTLEDGRGLADGRAVCWILLKRHRLCLAAKTPEWCRVRKSLPRMQSLGYAKSEIRDRFIPSLRYVMRHKIRQVGQMVASLLCSFSASGRI
jgi:hypothetical protein